MDGNRRRRIRIVLALFQRDFRECNSGKPSDIPLTGIDRHHDPRGQLKLAGLAGLTEHPVVRRVERGRHQLHQLRGINIIGHTNRI